MNCGVTLFKKLGRLGRDVSRKPVADVCQGCPLPDQQAQDLLDSMYKNEPQLGEGNKYFEIDTVTRIPFAQGRFLYDLHLEIKPILSVEIGLGYGFSTLFLLAAMKTGDYGHHIAIDPAQKKHWKNVGLKRVEILGVSSRFTFFEERSITAIPKLIQNDTKASFIFIDGNHRFDDVLVDFYLCENICETGGVIIFDDTWLPSIKKVLMFIRQNRKNFDFIEGSFDNMTVIRKIGEDERTWNHYIDF
jgi:predicted O-methyltransferase YrrM